MAMLPWWIHYPNVNNEIINLDWILQVSNENTETIKNFIGVNTIKYADPILWDITSQYEANTIVVDPQNGDAYISTKAVPYGVALSNEGYWTRIYNYASEIHTFREQIAADEELSTTATAPRSVDDLVFLNGLLYRVTAPMIAGDSYVEGSNCVKTTINAELLRLHASISNEAQAREDADTALGQRITDEATVRADADTALGQRITDADTALGQRITDADTALGQRITDEATARADADTALGGRIDDAAEDISDIQTEITNINSILASHRFVSNPIILAISDSYGISDSSLPRFSWFDKFETLINNDGYTLKKIALGGASFGGGNSGYTYLQALNTIIGTLTDEEKGRVVMVVIGGGYNDAVFRSSNEIVENAIQTFVTTCRTSFSNLASIYFAYIGNTFNSTTKAAIVSYPSIIRKLCVSHDILFLDTPYLALHQYSTAMQDDSIHPTQYGADTIAEFIYSAINGSSLGMIDYDTLVTPTASTSGVTLSGQIRVVLSSSMCTLWLLNLTMSRPSSVTGTVEIIIPRNSLALPDNYTNARPLAGIIDGGAVLFYVTLAGNSDGSLTMRIAQSQGTGQWTNFQSGIQQISYDPYLS